MSEPWEDFQTDTSAPWEDFGAVQKLNKTQLAALPQFQPEKVGLIGSLLSSPAVQWPVKVLADMNPARVIVDAPRDIGVGLGLMSPDVPRVSQQAMVSPEVIKQLIQNPTNPGGASLPSSDPIVEGLQNFGANTVSGLTTPEGVLSLATGRAAIPVFQAGMIASLPQQAANMQQAAEQGDTAGVVEQLAGMTMGSFAPRLMAQHSQAPVEKSGLYREDISDPRVFNMPNRPGIPMPDKEYDKVFTPQIIGQRPLDIGQKLVTPESTPEQLNAIASAYQSAGEPKQGGQISFEGQAGGIPNAGQQAQMSLAQMLEEAIKRNQIEKEQNATSLRGNEGPLQTNKGEERQAALQRPTSETVGGSDLQQTSKAEPTASHKERLVAPAIRTYNDEVFTGLIHALAVDKAVVAGKLKPNSSYYETGFTTESGRFVSSPEVDDIMGGISTHENFRNVLVPKQQVEFARSQEGEIASNTQASKQSASEPTPSDRYSEIQSQMQQMIQSGQHASPEFQKLWKESEDIKNKTVGMPPTSVQDVPLGEKLKQRIRDFNTAQQKRIASGDSMSRLDAGLFDDVVNIGKLAYGVAKDFGSWSVEMTKRLGEHVKPHLQEVWDSVKRVVDTRPDRPFVMESGELVVHPERLKLGLNNEGKYDAGQAIARLRNVLGENSAEWQILKDAKIQERFKPGEKVKPEEVRKWIDENGPKVEVRKFGSLGDLGNEQREYQQLRHEWFDTRLSESAQRTFWSADASDDFATYLREAGWSQREIEKAVRFRELDEKFQDAMVEHTGETSHWSSIAPKAEKDMPGYVEIAVVKPINERKSATVDRHGRVEARSVEQFPSSHSFPPNTLAFARGYMETTKDGKKVFHVIEVQSDWAQAIREHEKSSVREVNPGDWSTVRPDGSPTGRHYRTREEALASIPKTLRESSDPLLSHYERLALKAVIDHAKKEGAAAVAISDAETAMMTEGHDRARYQQFRQESFDALGRTPKVGDWVTVEREGDAPIYNVFPTREGAELNKQRNPGLGIKQLTEADFEPFQSAGMRLHYDRTLPKIIEELTGQKGERMEFGEHRMAMEGAAYDDGSNVNAGKPRKDLIFHNPDSTPKTSITANVFPLDKVKQSIEPTTILGKGKPRVVPPSEQVKQRLASSDLSKQRPGEAGFIDVGDTVSAIKDVIKGLTIDFQVLRDSFKRRGEFNSIVMKNQRVDNSPLVTANRARTSVDLQAKKLFGKDSDLALNGAIAVLEAKGDPNNLTTFLQQAAKNSEAAEGVKFAQANWNKLQPLVKAINALDTFNLGEAKKVGINIPSISDYLKRMYKGDKGFFTRDRNPQGIGYSSRLKRVYDNIYEAIEDGKTPLSFNAADLVAKRTGEIFTEIHQELWTRELKNMTDHVTKNPIAKDLQVVKGGLRVVPEGYVKVGLPNGKSIAVLDGYDRLIKALTGESYISSNIAGRALLQTVGTAKHGMFAVDSFHAARVTMFEKSLGMKNTYPKGLSILEYSNADLDEAVKQGVITSEERDYSREQQSLSFGKMSNREIGSELIKGGLGVGKHSEALYDSIARRLPIIGPAHKFIFDKLTRGAMMSTGVREFVRMNEAHPQWTKERLRETVARDINFRMGNIQKQGILKSKTMQDLAAIAFSAPKWVESMAQTEVRSVAQVGKALNPLGEGFLKPGTLGKSTAALVTAFVVGTQVINYLSTGKPTWQNPKDHRLDAWVPPITKNGKGFWISPLSVAAEITHDVMRLFNKSGDVGETGTQIFRNKLSNVGHAAWDAITGRNWKDEKLKGWDRASEAATELVNATPLPVRQAYQSAKQKDIAPFERQALAMVGVKSEPESYSEQKQRIIDAAKNGKSLSLFERKKLEKDLKDLRPTPTDAAKLAASARAAEMSLERKNTLRSEMPLDIQNWLKAKNLDLQGFTPEVSYQKQRLSLTEDEAQFFHDTVKEAYVQKLQPWVGKDLTQERLNGILEKAKMQARQKLKAKMQSRSKVEQN